MKKNYLSKSDMGRALSELKEISLQDAKSRISRLKIKEHQVIIKIEEVEHTISYFRTPEKFLKLE